MTLPPDSAPDAALASNGFVSSETIGPVNPRQPRRPAPLALRVLRYARLAAHGAEGALTVALLFGALSPARRRARRQGWSSRLLKILGIRLEQAGEPIAPGSLLVANHVSWVDIFVVNALAPSAFVSKAEVRRWPVIGWLAARNETVFLRRGSRSHARIINREIAAILGEGRNAALFPEGTTTDGSHVQHFHAALLQPALDAGHPVQALALSYLGPDGRRTLTPAYDGDIRLGECLAAIIAEQGLVARVRAAPALPAAAATDRRALARQARDWIAREVATTPA